MCVINLECWYHIKHFEQSLSAHWEFIDKDCSLSYRLLLTVLRFSSGISYTHRIKQLPRLASRSILYFTSVAAQLGLTLGVMNDLLFAYSALNNICCLRGGFRSHYRYINQGIAIKCYGFSSYVTLTLSITRSVEVFLNNHDLDRVCVC